MPCPVNYWQNSVGVNTLFGHFILSVVFLLMDAMNRFTRKAYPENILTSCFAGRAGGISWPDILPIWFWLKKDLSYMMLWAQSQAGSRYTMILGVHYFYHNFRSFLFFNKVLSRHFPVHKKPCHYGNYKDFLPGGKTLIEFSKVHVWKGSPCHIDVDSFLWAAQSLAINHPTQIKPVGQLQACFQKSQPPGADAFQFNHWL